MEKVANFMINKRIVLFIIVLLIAGGSMVLSTKTNTNTDMTKYLSDDSNMKQGIDIMESDFPEEEEKASIRVMVDDLIPREIVEMKNKLEEIPYVDTVTYEPESEDFNKENHTLFRITTTYGYDSEEELSIEETLENEFSDHQLVFQNDDIKGGTVPLGLLLAAVGMALVILVIMSVSWLEPVLFMITIGIAIIINMGTNIMFPYTADLTGSIAPIIQLALSMDYSIILMSRYRQEKEIHENKVDAMKAALSKSITSIASSSITTIAGLLALVFLSFKLGPELGIVLAKGIMISMLCVFTVLPVLILAGEKGIEKTKKKSPHIPMGGLAKFSFKARFVVSILFVILFISSYLIQKNTGITFTEGVEDNVAAVFPKDNQIVLIYNNKDESNIQKITSELEDDEHIKSMLYYTDALGKEYKAEEMSEVIGELAEDVDINKEIVSMLYYLKFNGEMPTITPEEFLHFLKKDVMTNDMLAEYMGTELTEQMDYIDKFSDKSKLTTPMTIQQMADFFELKSAEVKSLYLYYYTEKGGAATGRMKLYEFVDFVLNTVAKEDAYANMFDADTLSQLEMMKTYTDKAAMTEKRSYKETARLMEMDEDTAKMVYVYYYAMKLEYQPGYMTLPEFVDFMQHDVANSPFLGDYIDENVKNQMKTLATYTDKKSLQTPVSIKTVANTLGIDESTMNLVYASYWAADASYNPPKMTLSEFVAFMQKDIVHNPALSSYVNEDIKNELSKMSVFASQEALRKEYSLSELSGVLGIEEGTLKMIYTAVHAQEPSYVPEKMTLPEFVTFMKVDVANNSVFSSYINEETVAQIMALAIFTDKNAIQTELTQTELAAIFGMNETVIQNIFTLTGNATGTMTIANFINLALTTEAIRNSMDEGTINHLQMLKAVTVYVLNDRELGYEDIAGLLGMTDETVMRTLYVLHDAKTGTMTIPDAINFILSDDTIANGLDEASRVQLVMLQNMVHMVLAKQQLTYEEMANVLGMGEADIKLLFSMRDTAKGTISIIDTVNFILANDRMRAGMKSEEISVLNTLQTIMYLVLQDTSMSYTQMASTMGLQESDAKMLFTYSDAEKGVFEKENYLSVQEFVDFLIKNESTFGSEMGDAISELTMAQKIIRAAVSDTRYSASESAALIEMEPGQMESLYLLYQSKYGDISEWKLSPQIFVDFLGDYVLENDDFSDSFDAETAAELKAGRKLIDAIVSAQQLDSKQMNELLLSFTEEVSENDIELMYLYYAGIHQANENWAMTIPGLFDYLCATVMNDKRFSGIFDEKMKTDTLSGKKDMDEAIAQMQGEKYSRLIITTDYPEEAPDTSAFVKKLDRLRKNCLENSSYLVGTSVMVYEMENTFTKEFTAITLITAIAIFIVVLLAFRNLAVPLLLTLLVQGGVFITVAVIRWQGGSMYYLALLIVQSILMGATIDYGIVFCNYYEENRRRHDRKEALKAAYDGSIHTIMTSGSILVLVLAVLGMFSSSQVTAQVCTALSIGALVAVLLILIILPGMLTVFDRFIVKKKTCKNIDH